MSRNRITPFLSSDRFRLVPVAAGSTAGCSTEVPSVPPGAFVVPPAAEPGTGIHDLARRQALFELNRRKRATAVNWN